MVNYLQSIIIKQCTQKAELLILALMKETISSIFLSRFPLFDDGISCLLDEISSHLFNRPLSHKLRPSWVLLGKPAQTEENHV